MIVDARAISIDQAKYFLLKHLREGAPVPFPKTIYQGDNGIQPFDKIALVSITDSEMEKPFVDSEFVCCVEFKDIEPMNIDYVVPPGTEYMTEAHASKVYSFIKKLYAAPERILLFAHCRHGMCRSGAVVDFAGMYAGLGYWNTKRRNPQIVPNHWVQFQLIQALFVDRLSKNEERLSVTTDSSSVESA
ncbi:MAG: hypothetical protein E6R04_02190 [Spirochaetes bacterium]|nr:MAG: hypothetical protein E6R04_02190 [Spirochaetota bacterium]